MNLEFEDRYSLLWLFTISELLEKSPNFGSPTDLENCGFTLSYTFLSSKFLVAPGGVIGVTCHNLPINILINQLKPTLTQLNLAYQGYLELSSLCPNQGASSPDPPYQAIQSYVLIYMLVETSIYTNKRQSEKIGEKASVTCCEPTIL